MGWKSGVLPLQISDIRTEGLSAVRRKIRNLWRRASVRLNMWLNGSWAIPLVLLMRALRPVLLIRLGTIDSTRIGHFAYDVAGRITEFRGQAPNIIDLFWLGPTCNSQWELMVRRSLPIVQAARWIDLWNKRIPGGEKHWSLGTSPNTQHQGAVLQVPCSGMIPFLPSEDESALAWLRGKGWADGEPFVCLLVRDSAFLANDTMQSEFYSRNGNQHWSYHNYRDSNIEDYVPAMEWLADQGVWVLRMGKIMHRPIPTRHSRIVDYAFDPGKSDFLDIWLFANCTGCISTATGIDAISCVYGIPSLFLNATPLGGLLAFHQSIWVPKHLQWDGSGLPLTLNEYLLHDYSSSHKYAHAGIDLVDLSPGELQSAVQEFWLRIDGCWIGSLEDDARQQRFWTQFQAWQDFNIWHHTIHPKSLVGTAWLRSMGERFLEIQ